jgi:hypothetical protein
MSNILEKSNTLPNILHKQIRTQKIQKFKIINVYFLKLQRHEVIYAFFRAKWSDSWICFALKICNEYVLGRFVPTWSGCICVEHLLIIMTSSPIFVHFVWFLRTRSDTFIVRLKKGCLLPLFSDIEAQINILEENTVTGP